MHFLFLSRKKSIFVTNPYRESFVRIDLNHASKKILTIGWHEMGYMKVASLDFFQQLSQIVIVKGKSADQESVQDHTT